jgi:hypothetical protein
LHNGIANFVGSILWSTGRLEIETESVAGAEREREREREKKLTIACFNSRDT